ncbi:hypothetical protein [Roseomonas sp. BN140053]|uniref:hypothetical protein n=1 Tax=Roseomonas sp. BN140053 TaxID=3391898 RepID=UPI0039E94FE2
MPDAVLLSPTAAPTAVRSAAAAAVSTPVPLPAPSEPLSAPNLRLSYDYAVGMVVMEFRDSAGETRSSIPSERELDAYRRAVLTGAELPGEVTGPTES